MHTYTANDVQRIIDEAFRQGFEAGRSTQPGSTMPKPPPVHAVVDHPFTSSDAKGQYKQPWLNDPRGQRGLVAAGETESRK